MKLKETLKRIGTGNVISASLLIGIISLYGVGIYRNSKIKHNLEPDAISCGFWNNIAIRRFKRNPSQRNEDIDGNGKYESILRYRDEQGNRMYQEIRRNDEGRLILGEPRLDD